MARVKGPLMSMEASGSFGGAMVFAAWKGRPYARELVTPANPQTSDQTTVRNAMRVAGACQHWLKTTADVRSGETLTDKALLIAAAPSGEAWNGFFTRKLIGKGSVSYTQGRAAFSALASGEKTAWDTAADALTPPILDTVQGLPGGTYDAPMRSGEVFFLAIWGLSACGVAAAPTAIPPTYA